jgi:hypothetical protein
MKKLIHIRKPKLRITGKGVKISKPSARVGGKVGVNVSSKGVSASARTRAGSVSTRTGLTLGGRRRKRKGCPLLILSIILPMAAAIGAGVWLL